MKEFVEDNFKFDENGKNSSNGKKTHLGNGEIVCYEQFLLFQQYFQKTCTADM